MSDPNMTLEESGSWACRDPETSSPIRGMQTNPLILFFFLTVKLSIDDALISYNFSNKSYKKHYLTGIKT
jgi:hypothetical protein